LCRRPVIDLMTIRTYRSPDFDDCESCLTK
jgi:hypothetical protein